MLLAFGIMSAYLLAVIVTAGWLKIRPCQPDPSIAAMRVQEYLRKGRR